MEEFGIFEENVYQEKYGNEYKKADTSYKVDLNQLRNATMEELDSVFAEIDNQDWVAWEIQLDYFSDQPEDLLV